MTWSIGFDSKWKRDIGYGVPAMCDEPDCLEIIDRGLSHVCGAEPYGGDRGCGLFFCSKHQKSFKQLCSRCYKKRSPFSPKEDVPQWIAHKLTDESWADWRQQNEKEVAWLKERLRALVGEQWKQIGDTRYSVSNLGRVCSPRGGIVEDFPNRRGYSYVKIGKKKFSIHRLVACAFLPSDPDRQHVNHKDGDKKNNRVSNLEWCTDLENIDHAVSTGLALPIKALRRPWSGLRKLTTDQVLEIFHGANSAREAANKYGINRNSVYAIRSGKTWSSVTGKVPDAAF